MSSVIFNIAMLPEADFSAELVEASKLIAQAQPLEYQLGENSLPHVTVLQFAGQLDEADDIWKRVRALDMPPLDLYFHGLAFERWRRWDGIWLRLKHSASLRGVQTRAVAAFPERTFENGLGDLYEPHATIAAWLVQPRMPAFGIPAAVLSRERVRVTPALGISGPQFQFARKLFGD